MGIVIQTLRMRLSPEHTHARSSLGFPNCGACPSAWALNRQNLTQTREPRAATPTGRPRRIHVDIRCAGGDHHVPALLERKESCAGYAIQFRLRQGLSYVHDNFISMPGTSHNMSPNNSTGPWGNGTLRQTFSNSLYFTSICIRRLGGNFLAGDRSAREGLARGQAGRAGKALIPLHAEGSVQLTKYLK